MSNRRTLKAVEERRKRIELGVEELGPKVDKSAQEVYKEVKQTEADVKALQTLARK